MPELHQLTPILGSLLSRGFRVALVTDGRMSGASGSVPAALHLSPECSAGGPLARVRDGDVIRLNAEAGTLSVRVDAAEFAAREPAVADDEAVFGCGRELFSTLRARSATRKAARALPQGTDTCSVKYCPASPSYR